MDGVTYPSRNPVVLTLRMTEAQARSLVEDLAPLIDACERLAEDDAVPGTVSRVAGERGRLLVRLADALRDAEEAPF